jgi:hypothetical protein
MSPDQCRERQIVPADDESFEQLAIGHARPMGQQNSVVKALEDLVHGDPVMWVIPAADRSHLAMY